MADINDFFPSLPTVVNSFDPSGKLFATDIRRKGNINVEGQAVAKKEDNPLSLTRPSIADTVGFKVGSNPLPIQTPGQDQLDVQKSLVNAQEKTAKNIADQTSKLEDQNKQYKREKLLAAGAKFGIDLLNTMNQYRNVTGVARFNIMQARNQAADALYRGRQAGFQRQSEGQRAGEQALLAMAAQGQSVTSAGVQKIQQSYEAVGLENSMREEINGIREALGFQLEEIGQNYQVEMARNQAQMSVLSSALELGANAYGAGAFDGGL